MLNNLRMALVVTRREVSDQFRDWRIIFPVVALTIFFPALMNFTAQQAVNFVEKYNAPVVGERLIPFLLMVVGFFPISVSLVIALESFVGEKERHSIEPLLSSPLSDGQLYLGKLLASVIPTLLASYLGIAVYLVGVARIGWQAGPVLLIQILLLTTMQAIVMVSGAIVVSSQTTSVRAANLLASFIIIPMALLIQGESIVMFWAQYDVLWWAIFGEVIIASLLVRTGLAYFNREELLGRELDMLNLAWGWRVFKSNFRGEAHSIWEWYRVEIPKTLAALKLAIAAMIVALLIAVWVGFYEAQIFVLPKTLTNLQNVGQGFVQGLEAVRFFSTANVLIVWFHNLRSIALASILGLFSFGVLGVLVLMAPIALIAYFAAGVQGSGHSALMFITALVLPHGVFELPGMILAGAAILAMGKTMISPAKGKTISEAMLGALAQWARVMVGLVIPLALIAAVIEVFLTPRIAAFLLGG